LTERAAAKVLCAGIAVQDIIMRVEHFPTPGAKVHGSDFVITGGGCAANSAGAVIRLGGHAVFAGPIGGEDDAVSQRIIEDLIAEGIDCAGVVRNAGATASVSLILIDAAGEKAIATRRGSGLSHVRPRDPDALVADADAVLVDNRFPEFATAVCHAAKTRDVPIVIDLDLATTVDDALLKLGSHVIASSEALRGTTGQADLGKGLALLAQHLTGFLAVTDGEHGVFWREGDALRHMPAFKVPVVDTLGAGDVFHAGFALRLAETGDVAEAMRFGSAAAALKCTRFGGAAGAPHRAEVERFLQQQTR
jgi:sugar/nucleoside kinase (ribokinase family)